ncbi:MAG TPA: SH3 domain-containing protein [Microvirga sp.]|nr:SH3 domain-containing protein [Microvirga sp.]
MATVRGGFLSAVLAWALAAAVAPAGASALFGWQVADVPPGDLLNVRAFPSHRSRVLVGYANGTPLSLTGRCRGRHLGAVAGQPHWRQRQAVRDTWCEVWLDPTGRGEFRTGWVRGRYISPL